MKKFSDNPYESKESYYNSQIGRTRTFFYYIKILFIITMCAGLFLIPWHSWALGWRVVLTGFFAQGIAAYSYRKLKVAAWDVTNREFDGPSDGIPKVIPFQERIDKGLRGK